MGLPQLIWENKGWIVLSIVSSLFAGIAGLILWLNIKRQKLAHIPGPKQSSLLFGTVKEIGEMMSQGKSVPEYFLEMCKIYGPIYRLHLAHLDVVCVNDIDFIKEVFITGNLPKPYLGYNVMRNLYGTRFMGNGLVTINDKKRWAWKRGQLNPAFQKSYMRKLEHDFNEVSNLFMQRLEKLADGTTKVKMLDEFNHMALDMIAKVAFGVELRSVETDDNPFTRSISTSFEGLQNAFQDRLSQFKPWKRSYINRVRDSINLLRNYGHDLLTKRRAAIERNEHVPEDILNVLLKMKDEDPEMDEEEVLDEFVTLFVAGQETTGSLMSFMIYALGQHEDVLNRAVKEIDDVLGKKVVIEQNDLNRLTYLDMIVKETLRLYPPVGQTSRITSQPMTVRGYTIPTGTVVSMSTFVMSHLEENFPDPLKFEPERFSPEAEKKMNTYTYFPFTLGPRTCLGRYFADMEAKIVMTKLLQRFTFELVTDQEMGILDNFTIRPKGRAQCVLKLRSD